ncbi:MAG: Ribosomal protein [Planctomycetota bacterium]|jgi:large subunit ribosomal protein L35
MPRKKRAHFKLKTSKSAKKRFKVTKNGKILRTIAGKSHLMVGTAGGVVRKLRGRAVMHKSNVKAAMKLLRPSL